MFFTNKSKAFESSLYHTHSNGSGMAWGLAFLDHQGSEKSDAKSNTHAEDSQNVHICILERVCQLLIVGKRLSEID